VTAKKSSWRLLSTNGDGFYWTVYFAGVALNAVVFSAGLYAGLSIL